MIDNITISGTAGSGKSTIRNGLYAKLKKKKFKLFTVGEIVRKITGNNVSPNASLITDEDDRVLDEYVFKLLKYSRRIIVDAWLAGFISRNLTNVFRILVKCSDIEVKSQRVARRDKISVQDAKRYITQRRSENNKKWKRLYGNYGFFNKKYYNLVIDTKSKTPSEIINIIYPRIAEQIS